MGILLVTDILDEHRSLANLFGNGNPFIWGGLGWFGLFGCIAFVGYQPIRYIIKYLEINRKKAEWEREKEKNRVKLDSTKLNKEEYEEVYKKKKRELEKELKRKVEKESILRNEYMIYLLKDSTSFFNRKKSVKHVVSLTKNIEELEKSIENLEKQVSILDKEMETKIAECLSICAELQKKVEKYERETESADCELEKNKNNIKGKMKKKLAACGIIFLILFANRNNMLVTAQELKNTLVESINSLEGSEENEPETKESVSEDETPINKEENNETSSDTENNLREHTDYNFILEDAQLHKVMDDEIEDIIFLTGYSKDRIGYEKFLTNCRKGNMKELLPEVNCDNNFDLNELLNEIAEDLEKPFLEKIDKGKITRTCEEWERSAPNSMELANIIDKRRQVLGMQESVSIRRTIYFRLANDYQRLGKECLIQDKDGTQIYYYYGMSIYCCYCALGYKKSGKNSYSDEEILNYVKARYKDIMDNEKIGIPVEKVSNSEKMYSLLN